jgi:ParB family transcriptional regulator, chromosome partitioning protein
MAEKRHALGRGLDALIGDALGSAAAPAAAPSGAPLEVDLDQITPNRYQPRSHADEARIDELARSIKTSGLIQPILVRPVGKGYQLIAGERRWRAAQRAGLLKVPVTVRDVPDGQEQKLLELALIENIQRENLNAIEEAYAYKRLIDEFDLTQEEVADAVGKDRSTIANLLRLLKLPQEVRDAVSGGELAMGHARALLALTTDHDQRNMAREAVARGWSVRETEQSVMRALAKGGGSDKEKKDKADKQDVHTRAAQEKLRMVLGTQVEIARKGRGGEIRVSFNSEEELIRIYEILTAE